MFLFLLCMLTLFLILGIPIYVSLGLSTFLTLFFFSDINLTILVQRLLGGIDKFSLLAMPFFILAANAMDVGGLSKRLLHLARALVGHLTGGVGMTTQVASMLFGGLSGSAPATVVAIGKVMYPELIRQGYPKAFSSSLLASAGSVSLLIPPSLTMIIYATATNTSVGQLFMAGIGAGLIFGLLGLIYIYIYARKRNLRSSNKFSGTELWEAFKGAGWSLLVPVIILGGIYTGKFTPTEAASVSVVYALFVGMFIYKEIDLPKLYTLCVNSAITTAQVLILVAAASVFGWGLTISGVPQMLASFISEHFNNVWLFLLFLNLMLLVIGMFMDGTTAIVIVAPLIYPAAVSFGIDPVHLGIIMVANLAIGMYTPPFGLNIFVTNSITGLQMHDMIQGLLKFILVSIIALLLISYVPEISMFIPNLVYK